MAITYLKGDATAPSAPGRKIIAHICNDIGGWGKGFVLAVSKRWSEPEKQYREWYRSGDDFVLGRVQFVEVIPNQLWVANMIGQHRTGATKGKPPIRYEAVEACLVSLAKKAKELNASAHMPRIGCGLAGGTWDKIEPLIEKAFGVDGQDVYVYDF